MYIDYTQHKFLHINVTSSNKFVHKNVCKIIQTRKMSITRLEKSAKKYNISEKKFIGSVIKAATNHKSEAKCVCSKHNFNHYTSSHFLPRRTTQFSTSLPTRYVVLILLHTQLRTPPMAYKNNSLCLVRFLTQKKSNCHSPNSKSISFRAKQTVVQIFHSILFLPMSLHVLLNLQLFTQLIKLKI